MKPSWRYALMLLAAVALSILAVAGRSALAHDDDDDDDDDDAMSFYVAALGNGNRGFLGVSVEEETQNPEGGARITNVVDDSAADKAGLEDGDIIVGLNGKTVRGPRSLTEKLNDTEPGDSVEIEILRDGRRQTLTAELGKASSAYRVLTPSPKWNSEGWQQNMEKLEEQLKGMKLDLPRLEGRYFFGPTRPKLGVQLVETTPELRVFLGGTEDAGVLVGKVMSDMPAKAAGVEVGDLIIAVDGDEIESSGDLIDALSDTDGRTIRVQVVRDHHVKTIEVAIPASEDDQDEVTGPRASLSTGARAFREAERAAAEAMRLAGGEARRAMDQAARAYRDYAREARRASVESSRRARDEARRALREARRIALRDSV